MDKNEQAFRITVRQTLSAAKRLAMNSVAKTNASLRTLMAFALHNRTPTVYPFVLKYSFCRREGDGHKILAMAAALHLLQQSSLITDDIFDSGELRYNERPVYLNYDVSHAIIAAELLQAIAFRRVSEELAKHSFCNDYIASKLLNEILFDGYVGQHVDLFNRARLNITKQEYYHMIALGSGRVFQKIACCGALLAGKPETEIHVLSKFAYSYGMALFILDDIIDLLPAKETGKSYASDLKGRRMRLPIIMALRLANQRQRQLLESFLRRKNPREWRIDQVAAVIRESGALRASMLIANQYVTRSLRILTELPPSITRERFRWLAKRTLVLA
jgi:geranylgeranyl pyrophosphate synthase